MSGAHALLAPSAAATWIECPGSIALARDVPPSSSRDADLGSAKHWLGAECLANKREPAEFLGQSIPVGISTTAFLVDQEFVEQVQAYVDAIRRRVGRVLIEQKLDTSLVLGVPDQFGTGDAIVLNRAAKTIEIHDAKFGYHRVSADSYQLRLYGAAALAEYDWMDDWQTVECWIHQPSADWEDQRSYTRGEMLDFGRKAALAAQTAIDVYENPQGVAHYLTPGESQCQWCKARAFCPARAQAITGMFPAETPRPEPHRLTDVDIGSYLRVIPQLIAWAADVSAYALARAKDGFPIPGFKLVTGRQGNRAWVDPVLAEAALLEMLGDKAYAPRVILTPAAADKAVGKARAPELAPYWTRADGALTLVPDSDLRAEASTDPIAFPTTDTGEFSNGN